MGTLWPFYNPSLSHPHQLRRFRITNKPFHVLFLMISAHGNPLCRAKVGVRFWNLLSSSPPALDRFLNLSKPQFSASVNWDDYLAGLS